MVRTAAALALLAGASYAADSATRITLESGVVRARPAAAEATLELFVDGPAGVPPILGDVAREGDALRFAPRFPLRPGMRYRAVYRAPGHTPLVEVLEIAPASAQSPGPPTALERIDPTPDVLPENLLKLYLHFSAPMSRGEAYRRIHLLDEQGEEVELPFLEIDQELWDPGGKRLTLLFDPGRVKRDLLPNQEVGPPLEAGRAYTLVVDRGWPDARGRPLASEARKSFRVGPPDHTPPRTSEWRVAPPRAGTRDPLVVVFPEPLDRALLERVVEIWDGSGAPVPGEVAIDAGETRFRLTPRAPWTRGDYTLRAATILEDLAGNSLGRAFEVDVFERVEDRFLDVTANLRFQVAAAGEAQPRTRADCEAAHQAVWGRAGKDVPWVPTFDAVVLAMLSITQVAPEDVVLDLGAGDGKIAIAAAKPPYGARAVGIEYDSELAKLAACLVEVEGLGDKVRIVQGDIFKEDFAGASVVTMYLLPHINLCVRHRILGLEPGTRVVSHQYTMAEWAPDKSIQIQGRDLHSWVVPARVDGVWDFEDSQGTAFTIDARQSFGTLTGEVTRDGVPEPVRSATVHGRELRVSFDAAGVAATFSGTVRGAEITGMLRTGTAVRTATGRLRGVLRSAAWAEMPPDCARYYDR